jgi:signal recognition particle receptor subunit beta
VYKQTLPTVMSLQTNSSVIPLTGSKKAIRIVDVPGHPRIRDQFRDYLPTAKAIAFVVDSSTVSRNGAIVAECVIHVFDKPEFFLITKRFMNLIPDICITFYTR